MKEPYDFGKRLQDIRIAKGYSQSFVADRLNVSKQTISRYENNTQTPSLDALINLALFYNVSTDYLLGLDHRETLYIDGFDKESQMHILKILEIIQDNFKPRN